MQNDSLISAKTVRVTMGGITGMTLHRWVQRGVLPRPVQINGRNYWRRSDIEALKQGGHGRTEGVVS